MVKKLFMLISWCLIVLKLLKHLIQNDVKWNDIKWNDIKWNDVTTI